MTVVMKIDLVGPRRRGLALGLNESAGYLGVAARRARDGRARRDLCATHGRLGRRRSHRRGRACSSRCSSFATPPPTSREEQRAHGASDARALRQRLRARHAPQTRCCAPARRPAWSTTSTTRSPGASRRSTWPRTARASTEVGVVAAVYPAVWGAGQLADRLALRPHRAQAADRRRDARPGRGARAPGRRRRRLRAGPRRRRPARRRHGARLPDPDRRRLRRRPAGRARTSSSASTASGATSASSSAPLIAGVVADALGAGWAIAVVAALTAASGIWVALTHWASRPRPAAAREAASFRTERHGHRSLREARPRHRRHDA